MFAFQFPSNGKVFPNRKDTVMTTRPFSMVSIPFKREGLSELKNGQIFFNVEWSVSIPFKREGLSELFGED